MLLRLPYEALAQVAVAQSDADAAQATADAANANAAAAQATADALDPLVVAAQADADAAQAQADNALFGYTTVADIAARDALTPALDDIVVVSDATADPAVAAAVPAVYQWNGSAWVNVTDTFVTYQALQVASNADLIATNASNIAGNAESIANLADQVATNAEAIANNADTTATTASNVATNADSVATNAENIAINADSVATNAENIAINADNIADAAAVTATNAENIATTAQGAVTSLSNSIGVADGIASLDGSGLVPASQLPSYVDDVVEVADFASLPVTGENGKIYVTIDTNDTYRWTGTVYIEVSASDVVTVNGQSGTVVLDADDISDAATTNKFTTAADISKLATIEAGAEVNPALMSQAEAEAGTATDERVVSAERLKQAITFNTPTTSRALNINISAAFEIDVKGASESVDVVYFECVATPNGGGAGPVVCSIRFKRVYAMDLFLATYSMGGYNNGALTEVNDLLDFDISGTSGVSIIGPGEGFMTYGIGWAAGRIYININHIATNINLKYSIEKI